MWIRPIPLGALLVALLWLAGGSTAWAVPTPSPTPVASSSPLPTQKCMLTYTGVDAYSSSWLACSTLAVPEGGWCVALVYNYTVYFLPCSLSAPTPSPTPSDGSPSPSVSASGDPSASSSPSATSDPGSSSSPSASGTATAHVWTDEEASELVATLRGLLVAAGLSVLALAGLLVMSVRR